LKQSSVTRLKKQIKRKKKWVTFCEGPVWHKLKLMHKLVYGKSYEKQLLGKKLNVWQPFH
jgi:hypothetical protein